MVGFLVRDSNGLGDKCDSNTDESALGDSKLSARREELILRVRGMSRILNDILHCGMLSDSYFGCVVLIKTSKSPYRQN